jgi:SAM-dependent methyltransferase
MLTAAEDWYQTAFGPITAAFWTGLAPAARIEQEARFLAEALAVPAPARLLDVPCGAGRQARMLGRLGYRVLGIDISPHMLAAASNEGLVEGVELRQGRMSALGSTAPPLRAPPVAGTAASDINAFDGAYCWGNSFGYLPHEENLAFLEQVAAALKPGARFVLDVGAVAEAVLSNFQARTVMEAGGFLFTAERRYALAESAMHIAYRIERGGEAEEFVARMAVYTAAEIIRLAGQAGFAPISQHGGIGGEPAALGKPLVAVFVRT